MPSKVSAMEAMSLGASTSACMFSAPPLARAMVCDRAVNERVSLSVKSLMTGMKRIAT